MRRFLAAQLIVLACLFHAATGFAQSIPFPGPGTPHTVGATYQGPGDVVSGATFWYGLRAYNAATAGNRAINLCDNTGANCADISTNSTTGKLNAPGTLGSNNCNTSGTCRIFKWYDQSGALACGGSACDLTELTAADPTLNFSCINSLPCAVFAGAQALGNVTATAPTFASGTVSSVATRTGAFTSSGTIITTGGTSLFMLFNFRQVANAVQMYLNTSGQFISNITDSNFHAFQAVYNGASGNLMCGGSAGTSCSTSGTNNAINPGNTATGASATICVGAEIQPGPICSVTTVPLTGEISEVGSWNGAIFTGTQQTNMNANQYSFWGPF